MDILLIIFAFLCILIGLAGSVLPALPGPPLSYVGMLLLHFTDKVQFSVTQLVVWAVLVIIIQILDFVIPSIGTKKFGGSCYGVWGCNIGVIVGLFAGPLGIILGPFLGAVIGEFIKTNDFNLSLKAGFGAFLGFISGTIIKIAIVVYFLFAAIFALV